MKDNLEIKKIYHAQEVADMLGISKQTLFRYERRKVFPAVSRNHVNGWREYTEKDIIIFKEILGRP